MNIPKAIEILTDCLNVGTQEATPDINDAIKLGVEALEFRLRWEQQEGEDVFPLLPGETKD